MRHKSETSEYVWAESPEPPLDEVDCATEEPAPLLPLLTLDEAHELLDILVQARNGAGSLAQQADRLAGELAARVPSRG